MNIQRMVFLVDVKDESRWTENQDLRLKNYNLIPERKKKMQIVNT